MRSRVGSSSRSSKTTASSSSEDTEDDGNSDRHSTTPSPRAEPEKEEGSRKKEKVNKGRLLEHSDDDHLSVKFRRHDDEHPRRRNSPRDRKRQVHRSRDRLRSPRSRDGNRRWKEKRDEKYRRSCSRDEHGRRNSRLRSAERRRAPKSRNKSGSPYSPTNRRGKEIKKEEPDDEDSDSQKLDTLRRTAREDAIWAERRKERDRRCEWGVRSVWGRSPLMHEIHEVYEDYERLERELRKEEEEQLPMPLNVGASEAVAKGSKKEKGGHKKKQKDKKSKKKHKKKPKKSSSESEEWVEVTAEMREAEAAREKMEEAAMVGPAVPDHLVQKQAALIDTTKRVNYGKDMLRGEAAAMASYIAQGKRIPRRGEIGLSSAEISEYEKIGYVMSGTRHKSMEATRLRKENQVMTAEEKRLLSGFTHDERKKKEEIVLQQFKSFIESKKGKN